MDGSPITDGAGVLVPLRLPLVRKQSPKRVLRPPGRPAGIIIKKKEGVVMVELDQFKYTLSSYAKPMTELRDSL